MFDVKIFGEIVPFQDEWIEENGYFNSKMLAKQLEKAEGKPLRVLINSYGGDVDEGFAIYSMLRRYAKENNVEITTLTSGYCASIATVIFLAGDKRVVNRYVDPFIHNAWVQSSGDANKLRMTADMLEKCNEKIAQFYSEHTEMTFEEALNLMQNDTSLTPEECKALRFATEIEELPRPQALKRLNVINKQSINMSDNKENQTKSLLERVESAMNALNVFLAGTKTKEKPVNKIIYTAENVEIDFYELGEDYPIEVGAKARIEGNEAEGSYLMQNGETYIFNRGELTEKKSKEEEQKELEEVNALRTENQTLKAELESYKAKLEDTINVMNSIQDKIKNSYSLPAPENKKENKKEESKINDLSQAITNRKRK